jgi:hypothetical protein
MIKTVDLVRHTNQVSSVRQLLIHGREVRWAALETTYDT